MLKTNSDGYHNVDYNIDDGKYTGDLRGEDLYITIEKYASFSATLGDENFGVPLAFQLFNNEGEEKWVHKTLHGESCEIVFDFINNKVYIDDEVVDDIDLNEFNKLYFWGED